MEQHPWAVYIAVGIVGSALVFIVVAAFLRHLTLRRRDQQLAFKEAQQQAEYQRKLDLANAEQDTIERIMRHPNPEYAQHIYDALGNRLYGQLEPVTPGITEVTIVSVEDIVPSVDVPSSLEPAVVSIQGKQRLPITEKKRHAFMTEEQSDKFARNAVESVRENMSRFDKE